MLNDFSGSSEMLFRMLGTAFNMPDKDAPEGEARCVVIPTHSWQPGDHFCTRSR